MNDVVVLDPTALQELLDMGAEASLVQELVALFQEDVPPRIARVGQAFAAGDPALIQREAHQLKGATGNLGLMRFAELASRLESLARAQDLGSAGALVAALPGAYEEALSALEAAFPLP